MAHQRALEPDVPACPMKHFPGNAPRHSGLEASVGHVFADQGLLNRALTHVSALATDTARDASYQRLEFLGDRVLGLAVSSMLCTAFPEADEGELSRRLAELVRRESCAEVAAAWGASAHIQLGEGEAHTGGARKAAILADICESIIGAVFLDGGFAAASRVIESAFSAQMHAPRRPLQDAKTQLQEWAQGRGLPTPAYRETGRSGPAHAPHFQITVQIEGFAAAHADGASKRTAEQAAAEAFLQREGLLKLVNA